MSDIPKLIGERIRNYRKEKGLNQEELAHRAGLHSIYIGQLERGEKQATISSLEKIINVLGISLRNCSVKSVNWKTMKNTLR
ncbi:helix-turn-helix domain-containing protein [Halalkalibacter urbisdiaboli]|uniref:helix-turn-helix domain-containing protein n=1 Tax=Halalkalibacter urbisdiaboli TaxID=1960589 RepID=UPI001FD8E62C|nr:helix-turn-helix transcriptional regulator [Halalkalibacter urbisdiaboli]